MKVLFTDYDMLDVSLERQLFAQAGIELVEAQCKTEAEVIEASAGCSGLLVQYAPVNAKVFAARPEIRVVARIGAGYDTVNAIDAQAAGVWVANSPDYGVGEVATHALAMMLDCIRGISRYNQHVRAGHWHYTSVGKIPRASDMTVGIVGLGRIGKRFAHLARNIFKRVIAYDPHLIDGDFPAYVERVRSLPELFAQADAVSIHCLLTDHTRSMINAQCFEQVRAGSYLVNTARGAVIDIDALTTAVQAGRYAGVGLDVLPIEPMPVDHPLLQHEQVLISPHSAFYSATSEIELRRKAATNLVTWRDTGRPDYPVNNPQLS
jgi:phosphoglycerate dehydrogenase-like enzyme